MLFSFVVLNHKTKLGNAARDLADLFIRVRPRIAAAGAAMALFPLKIEAK